MDAEASGDAEEAGSSDLLQAAAAKNIEIRSRTRILRIASSLNTSALHQVAQKTRCANAARILYENSNFKRAHRLLRAPAIQKFRTIFKGIF